MDAHHTHTNPSTPGYFSRRAPSLNDRNFSERAFTVGIGVPVGTGLHVLLVLSFFYQEMRDANGQWELKKIQSTSAETLLVTANILARLMKVLSGSREFATQKCCLNDKEGVGASWGIIFYSRWITCPGLEKRW
ncbi:hypothetical protein HA466_0006580 [Hirschfeldia incana]|nr:hypothetical protein HA466_0006580 [Hirschfeldia incana]